MSNTYRCDNNQPENIKSAVTSSQTVQGADIEMFGGMGFSAHVVCTNGAAGTLYIDGTNQWTDPQRGNPVTWQQGVVSQALTANQAAMFQYSLVDPITQYARVRCRFVSSAAGNVQVATNVRRMTY